MSPGSTMVAKENVDWVAYEGSLVPSFQVVTARRVQLSLTRLRLTLPLVRRNTMFFAKERKG